jgi:hypothetical protein
MCIVLGLAVEQLQFIQGNKSLLVCTNICMFVHMYDVCMYVCIPLCMCIVLALAVEQLQFIQGMNKRLLVCTYVCTYVCMYV